MPPVADDPALAALPPFPDLTIMDDDESCFALSDDEPIITAINVAPLPDAEAIGAAMSLEPIGGSDPSDGYFAHSEAFMSPVPESLPIGFLGFLSEVSTSAAHLLASTPLWRTSPMVRNMSPRASSRSARNTSQL